MLLGTGPTHHKKYGKRGKYSCEPHKKTIWAVPDERWQIVVEAPKPWSYIVHWERFKDGLVTKDSQRSDSVRTLAW